MVDVRKRTLQWQENLERTRRPEDREQQHPPVEVTTLPRHYEITAELAGRLNAQIANYNRDRNTLSLWNVLAICLENKIPVPDKVDEFFPQDLAEADRICPRRREGGASIDLGSGVGNRQ
jgi:hypothetical protein